MLEDVGGKFNCRLKGKRHKDLLEERKPAREKDSVSDDQSETEETVRF